MGEVVFKHKGRVTRRVRFPYTKEGVAAVRRLERAAVRLRRSVTKRKPKRRR